MWDEVEFLNRMAATGRKTLLLIDDEPDLLGEFSFYLEGKGYRVISESQGRSAIDSLPDIRPDLVICDVSMPEMNGHAVLQEIRGRSDRLKNVPFMFLTAHTMLEDELKGLGLGADDFVGKQEAPDKILAKIKSRLAQAERLEIDARERIEKAREQARRAARRREKKLIAVIQKLASCVEKVGENVAKVHVLMEPEAEPMLRAAMQDALNQTEETAGCVRMATIIANMVGRYGEFELQKVNPVEVIKLALSNAGSSAISGVSVSILGSDEDIMSDPHDLAMFAVNLAMWSGMSYPGSELELHVRSGTKSAEMIMRAAIHNPYHAGNVIAAGWLKALTVLDDESLEDSKIDPALACVMEIIDAIHSAGGRTFAVDDGDKALITLQWDYGLSEDR